MGCDWYQIIVRQEAFEKCWAIPHNEPPYANSPDVASGTVVCHLRIDVYNNDNDNDDDDDNA